MIMNNKFDKQEFASEIENYRYVIDFNPFKISVYLNDKLMVIVNRNNFFNFETERTV
jgi:hypothetical protein